MSADVFKSPQMEKNRPLIAPFRHTLILLLIQLAIAGGGAYMQQKPGTGSDLISERPAMAPFYVFMIILEWALVYYVWIGIRNIRRVTILGLVNGKWKGRKNILLDLVIAVPFWFIWEGAARLMHGLLGQSNAKAVTSLLPQGIVEVILWCALSVSAGFCEEVVYRGYLQTQFKQLTGSLSIALLGQALVFGLAHAYQGTKQVVVIAGLGLLYGGLAAWRKNLRPGILAHAWSDVYGGWMFTLLMK